MDVLGMTAHPACGIVLEVHGPEGGVATVSVTGEMDAAEALLLERAVLDLCAAPDGLRPDLVVVDLGGVGFFGSRGLAALVIGHDAARRAGVRLRVATGEGNRRVRRPVEVTGVDTVVPVFATVAGALAAP